MIKDAMLSVRWLFLLVTSFVTCSTSNALAQEEPVNVDVPFASPGETTSDIGDGTSRVTDSAVGRAGQRQAREQIDGIKPMARINNRFANRVQNRSRNRIDRNYDPRANAISPFVIASDQVRTADPRSRR